MHASAIGTIEKKGDEKREGSESGEKAHSVAEKQNLCEKGGKKSIHLIVEWRRRRKMENFQRRRKRRLHFEYGKAKEVMVGLAWK